MNLLLPLLLACTGKFTPLDTDSGATDTADPGPPPTDDDGDGWFTPEDCDDGDPLVNPDAVEVCDGADNNCDGNIDVNEAVDATPWYKDGDGDGYGDPAGGIATCSQPPGFVPDGTDCDDANPATNPGAPEVCNDGSDNNCNGDALECAISGELLLADAPAIVWGEAGGDQAGSAIAGVGDVDGDGFDDLMVGAPYRDAGGNSDAGAAYLLSGPLSGSSSLSAATAILTGTSRSDKAGIAVAGAGDVDGDGYADLLVSAWHSDLGGADSGAVYLLRGPVSGTRALSSAEAILVGEVSYDYAGVGLSGGVDLTGDGRPDIVLGAYGQGESSDQNRGRAYVVSGEVSGTLDLAKATAWIDGSESYDRVSQVVALGDVDGDGSADLAVGAWSWPDNDNQGAAFVFSGPLAGALTLDDAAARLEGEEGEGQAGTSLAGAGDVNGDGYEDLLVGAPLLDTDASEAGVAWLVFGPMETGSLAGADLRFVGTEARADFGYSVAGGGDFDGDGRPDVLIGAPSADGNGTDSGGAWLYYTPAAGTLGPADADLVFVPELARDLAGGAVSFVGNVNGDCCDDVGIGATASSRGGAGSGAAWFFMGQGI